MRRVGRYAFPDDLERHVLGPLREKVTKAIGKNSPAGLLSSCLIGVWSSTDWAPSASIIFIVDENSLTSLGVKLDLGKAVGELLNPVRKALGRQGLSVQVTGTVRTLEAVSAFDLFIGHRQLDLDALPVGEFAAKDSIAALAAGSAASTGRS